jgi:hypothetical protein
MTMPWTDALILDLSTDLPPVRRRNVSREAAVLLALGVAELGLLLLTAGTRPDMDRVILSPFMIWKIGSLAVLAGVSCAVAVRSFAPPGLPARELRIALGLSGLAIVAGMSVTPAADIGRPLLERLAPTHGVICAASIVALSLPVTAMLAMLMRRAAPVSPRRSALASGLAAATTGALIFTARCPMNDPLYIVVWYTLAIAAVSAVARWLLPSRFRL